MKLKVRMVVIALAGVGTSLAAVANFVLTVFHNRLPSHPEAREFYLVVGRSYTEGFAIGFFLCFSLAVAATAVSGLLAQRRSSAQRRPLWDE